MELTALTEKINTVFNPKKLNTAARETGFITRKRQIKPLEFLLAFVETLGCQAKANLADIHRKYQIISGMPINYKPFHNQIKKEKCSNFFKNIFELALKEWVIQSLKLTSLSTGKTFPFNKIIAHDGSSFAIHAGLKDVYPGRFNKHSPAAVELHVSMDLLSSSIDYFQLTADTESERLHSPKPETLKNTLTLEDAGYFDRERIMEINKQGGFIITQAACSINPTIQHAYDHHGKSLSKLMNRRLKTVKLKDKTQTLDLTVRWPNHDMDFRVIAFWHKKKKRVGFLVTNLPRETVPAHDVIALYRLRWQIELLFKELKSYCNLKKFSTQNKHIVTTLIYASFITVLLKRLLAFGTELLKSVCISTQKTARSASEWLKLLVSNIAKQVNLLKTVCEVVDIISNLCRRSHPKRDFKDGLYQFGVEPLANICIVD